MDDQESIRVSPRPEMNTKCCSLHNSGGGGGGGGGAVGEIDLPGISQQKVLKESRFIQ